MVRLSQALQRHLAEVEVVTAIEARAAVNEHDVPPDSDLLVVDGPLRGRQHLPRSLGYIKSHHSTYLPPELNALVAALAPGQRTPVFLMGTSWDRHSWYLRLPGAPGSPWAGVVRIECSAELSVSEVTRLAAVSQKCPGRFASAAYKDSRAPQNLYPIAGLERELRRRLGDPRLVVPCTARRRPPERIEGGSDLIRVGSRASAALAVCQSASSPVTSAHVYLSGSQVGSHQRSTAGPRIACYTVRFGWSVS
jgi:hypothetical protein